MVIAAAAIAAPGPATLGLPPFPLPAELAAQEVGGPAPDRSPELAAILERIQAPRTPGSESAGSLSLTELLEATGVPGVSVAVVHDFELHWTRGFGTADVVTGAPVTPETLFQAASISKPITAMAVLRLAREGRLDLDGDVNSFLRSWLIPPRPEHAENPVTFRALLSHTSGASDGFGFPGYDPEAPRPDVVGILNGAAPSNTGPVLFTRPPFEAYQYSGGGTTIVQLALAESAGEPFASLMESRVLGPLGMNASTFEQPLPPERAARASRAHDRAGEARSAPWHVYPEQAAAGLWTTSADLARFIIEVQRAIRGPEGEGTLLDRATALEMITPVGVGPFGAGLMVDRRGEGWYFSHTGSNRGFRGLLLGHVRKGYGVVILTNADRGGEVMNELLLRVAEVYGWDMVAVPLRR